MIKKLGIGCLGIIGVWVVTSIIVAVAGGRKTAGTGATEVSSSAGSASIRAVSSGTSTIETGSASTTSTGIASSTQTAVQTVAQAQTSPNNDQGVVFGKPISIPGIGAAALVTNTSGLVMSFTVQATYKNGNTVLATAAGAVNDLLPNQKRAVVLVSTQTIPAKYSSVRVDVDTMISKAKATMESDAIAKIKFGAPSVNQGIGLDVEVTNGDAIAHFFTVSAALLKGGNLVGVASGAVNDLGPGQTKTATLVAAGTLPAYDQTSIAVDSLVQ